MMEGKAQNKALCSDRLRNSSERLSHKAASKKTRRKAEKKIGSAHQK